MSKFLDRASATAELRNRGVPLGNTALANMASSGIGPRYFLINGRALYKPEDLNDWVNMHSSVPLPRAAVAEPIATGAA